MTKVWVDPPSGWKYGFPCIWDDEEYSELEDLYDAKGYPESLREHAWIRMWPVSEEEQ